MLIGSNQSSQATWLKSGAWPALGRLFRSALRKEKKSPGRPQTVECPLQLGGQRTSSALRWEGNRSFSESRFAHQNFSWIPVPPGLFL